VHAENNSVLRAVVTFAVRKLLPLTATSKSARRVLREVVQTLLQRLTAAGHLPQPPPCAKPSPKSDALFELLQVCATRPEDRGGGWLILRYRVPQLRTMIAQADGQTGTAVEQLQQLVARRADMSPRLVQDMLLHVVQQHVVLLDKAGDRGGFEVALWRLLQMEPGTPARERFPSESP